tara:strand:+ start:2168 stop:3637 length:1470 start_codon:yes stop_codon:yes gene_type:complete
MSWKKYGGVNNYEAMSDLTINNLVADHTISKYDVYSYEGVINYIYALDLLNAKNISVLEEEVYLDASRSEYLYGYLDPSTNFGNIGVNTKTAQSTVDIRGDNPLSLNVFTSAPYNQNIIARNNDSQAISVYVDNSFSQLHFASEDSFITDVSNVLYSNDYVLNNTLTVQGITTLYEEVYLDASRSEYFYGTNGNIGINTKTPQATLDIVGTNPYSLNVYSNTSFNQNIIARNSSNRSVNVYVDNTIGELQFPGANITEKNGIIYLSNLDASYGNFVDLSANTGTINTLEIGVLKSINQSTINILPDVSNIYVGTGASYIELGNENTVVNIQGTQKVKDLESNNIQNSLNITTDTLDANTVTATRGVFDTINITEQLDISVNMAYSSITIGDGDVSNNLTILENATFYSIGDACMNSVHIIGPLTSAGQSSFSNIDVTNLDVTNLNVTNNTSLKNLSTSGTVNINLHSYINDGVTVVGDLNCQQSTIIQW